MSYGVDGPETSAGVIAAVEQYAEPAACPTRFLNKATDSSVLMKLLVRKTTSLLVGVSITLLIALCSLGAGVQAQPTTPPAIPSSPHLTLTAEQEYIIREIILKDVNVPKENSAPETIGDSVPETVKLYTLPSEIIEKVPKAQSHKFFVKDDMVILVSPSDRRIDDVIKKKSSD